MEPNESLISDRVRKLLEQRGISGSELARRIGASQSYVSRRIQGVVPWRAIDLVTIAADLEVDVVELLTGPTTETADAA